MESLIRFIVLAHKNGYGNPNVKKIKISNSGKKIKFEKGNFAYEDLYEGTNLFWGQEKIFYKKNLVWMMNYYGKCELETKQEKIYAFLKNALINCTYDSPFRGPKKFEEGGLGYFSHALGDLTSFRGSEKILEDGNEVYIGVFLGGLVR